MAKAKITTPEGMTVEIVGTPAEVAAAVEEMRGQLRAAKSAVPAKPRKGPAQIRDLVAELKGEEFFKTPRGLGEIQKKLADLGHRYPLTTLSGAMQAQAKSRSLRRFKQEGKYVYVQ